MSGSGGDLPPNRRRADMDELLSAFTPGSDGSWTCRHAAVLHTHWGPVRFTPGALFAPNYVFMGIDVTRLLNEYRKSGLAPVSWRGQRHREAEPD